MSRIYDALKKAEQESRQKSADVSKPAPTKAQDLSFAPAISAPVAATAPVGSTVASAGANAKPATDPPVSAVQTKSVNAAATPAPITAEINKTPIRIFSATNGELRGAEEFRRLRTKLQHAREKVPFRSLLVTSAVPGEGKTFISINLAHTLTLQHSARVVVVDADLRKPQLHSQLDISNDLGLTDYLEGRCGSEAIIRNTAVPNLHVITGGGVSTHVAELAGSPRFSALITSLSEQFEWVIVDTSPVIPVTDAALLAPICDATLLVVAASETSGDLAQLALKELKEANIIGVVLNRATRTSSKYHNYYYYKHAAHSGTQESQSVAVVTQ